MKDENPSNEKSEYQILMEEIKSNNNILDKNKINKRDFKGKRFLISPTFLCYLFFRKYGRIGRAEYLFGNIFLFIVIVIFTLSISFFPAFKEASIIHEKLFDHICLILILIYFIGNLNLTIKRAHDLERSGLSTLFWLIMPIANIYVLLSLNFFRGTVGENAFGNDPL